jgi:hypothetical protein
MAQTKQKINQGFEASLTNVAMPQSVKEAQQRQFTARQQAYGDKVVTAFALSIHTIFVIAAGIMGVAFVLTLGLKERTLRVAKAEETPGEL